MDEVRIMEKGIEYSKSFEEKYQLAMLKAWVDCAAWMQEQYKPLIDIVIENYRNECLDISGDIMDYDEEWCNKNCTEFCEKCVKKWLDVRNKPVRKGE